MANEITARDAIRSAERCFRKSAYHEALAGFLRVVAAQPENLDARLRVADCLLALEFVQQAAQVYAVLARHTANAGYPLRCLAVLKILGALEPQFESLLGKAAQMYSCESPRLGKSVRVSLGDPSTVLPGLDRAFVQSDLQALVARATELACSIGDDLAQYSEKLPPIPLLSELSADGFERLVRAAKLVRCPAGYVVVRAGEQGESFFMVARGEVEVLAPEIDLAATAQGESYAALAILGSGSIFGEMALVSSVPRTASVRATESTELIEFDRESLQAASRELEAIAIALDSFTRKRLLHNLMESAPFFRPLDRPQRLDLIRRFKALDFMKGTPVIEEGAAPKGLFVVLRGEVSVTKDDGNGRVLLAKLGPGEVFGEIALMRDRAVSATVKAVVPSTLLFLDRHHFLRLIEGVPEIGSYVASLGEERLEETELVLGMGFVTSSGRGSTLPPPYYVSAGSEHVEPEL